MFVYFGAMLATRTAGIKTESAVLAPERRSPETSQMRDQPTQAEYEAEIDRQRRICEKDPDCVQRAGEPWGTRLRCRCLELESEIMAMKARIR